MSGVRSILCVCLGNICRSPLAEGILRREAANRGLDLTIDSAGTGGWHVGELPDPRARTEGAARGCDMSMCARQVQPDDFERFDLILAMDQSNVRELLRVPGARPEKIRMMRSFDPTARWSDEVPDPYYGDESHFTEVAEMIERAVEGLLDSIEEK